MPLVVVVGQASLAGPTGPNQDYAGAVTPEVHAVHSKGVVLALADGVGKGRGGGALAEAAVRFFLSGWYASPETWAPGRCLVSLLAEGNRMARRDHPGAACTFTAAVLVGRSLHVAHVGDSRAWLIRDHKVSQLTTDHVWDNPDLRSVLHRAVGLDEDISPQLIHQELCLGDLVVLASDGFHKSFDPQRLGNEADEEIGDAWAERLVAVARQNGSDDDTTVVLAKCIGLPELQESVAMADVDLPPMASPCEGLEIDGFRLQKRLGGGRLTSVWLADDRELERRVVIKIPTAQAVADLQVREEFWREEWVGKRLCHPGLVPVLALRPGRRTCLYYIMPWSPGVSMRRILAQGPLDAYATTQLGLELAAALRYLHRQGVLHRDIKPDNILRDESGRSRLVDLGVARVEVFSDATGAEPGTASYMAPELFEGHPASEATEIFALGVTLYECLTRKLPFGEIEPFTRPKYSRPVPLSRWNPEIPPWLETVVLKAVEPDPGRRFQVLSELEFHLERRERVLDAGPVERADPERVLRIWKALAILAGLLAILEAVALVAGQ